jgi:beta-N-acetylhexosaminidase
MTVEQKVGQLFMVHFDETFFSPALEEMVTDYHVGGIIIFPNNLDSLADLSTLIADAQQAALENGSGIPLLVAADQEGWPILRLPEGATVFPSNMALGATGSVEDARLMASVMAEEMRALGMNMNLAPVMDVNTNPLNPVIGTRSFGSSPDLVSRLGAAMIETYQSQGIVATAKHFPGHGDTSVDSHLDLPVVQHDLAHLWAVELAPFQAAISADVDCIMIAHLSVPALDPASGRPATLSREIIQGLLREQMGFQGAIATDSLSMSALMREYDLPTATALAFEAGADLLLFGHTPEHPPSEQLLAYERVLQLVKEGTIAESRLDDSVRRILLLKARRGVLDYQAEGFEQALEHVGTAEHQAVAARVALDSITLVREETNLLPLSPESMILVVYPRGGAALGQAVVEHSPQALPLEVSEDPTAGELERVRALAQSAQVVVVGTRTAMNHPGQVQLVETLRQETSVIAVALDSPYDLLAYPAVSTYLATYGRAPAPLQALTDVLFGLKDARGTLPIDLPGLE